MGTAPAVSSMGRWDALSLCHCLPPSLSLPLSVSVSVSLCPGLSPSLKASNRPATWPGISAGLRERLCLPKHHCNAQKYPLDICPCQGHTTRLHVEFSTHLFGGPIVSIYR